MTLSLKHLLEEWVFFSLSKKLKFAIKVSFSLMLAYMIPMAMGWDQANIAAMTVMFIAGSGTLRNSFNMGILRIVGTVIGATIGLTLIALFPQERVLYLLSLSLVMATITYLHRAYQGDKTILMLTGVVTMMMYTSGPENAFIYGIDRTYMTIFGIVIYTAVGVFIWPDKNENNDTQSKQKLTSFVWLDPEHFKATIQLFLIFWFSVAFWIFMNPPGGFLIVIFASAIGLLISFSPIKPTLLMLLFSIGFIFATLMYVFVLPNLVYAWELALFLFIYTFIGFYFINPKMSIFFLLGMFLLGINNTMSYNFDVFLMILLTIYTFLVILMFFYNFPFSSKPEYLFSLEKDRFFSHAEALDTLQTLPKNYLNNKKITYHKRQLYLSSKKIHLWGSKVDTNYFSNILKEHIEAFSSECEKYIQDDSGLQLCYNSAQAIDWKNLEESRF